MVITNQKNGSGTPNIKNPINAITPWQIATNGIPMAFALTISLLSLPIRTKLSCPIGIYSSNASLNWLLFVSM